MSFRLMSKTAASIVLLLIVGAMSIFAQEKSRDDILSGVLPPEKLIYPSSRLLVLNPKLDYVKPPFDLEIFNRDILQRLRSENYLDVVTEDEVLGILKRNHLEVPNEFEPKIIGRMGKVTECDNVAYMRIISFELDKESGYGIPLLAHRNKVIYRAVLELTIVSSETATAKYYENIVGRASVGCGVQVFPVTMNDPNLFLNFRQQEDLARSTLQDLSRRTMEATLKGIHQGMEKKYICYWDDEVHIISDKPGLCPICGSRLHEIRR